MLKKFYITGICLFAGYFTLRAETTFEPPTSDQHTALELSLSEALAIGLENNYGLRITRNLQRIAENDATPGNAGFLPSVDVTGSYAGTLNSNDQRLTDGTTAKYRSEANNSVNAGIGLNWSIFEGFSIRTNYARLKELSEMGELNTMLAVENFISAFTTEYYNFIRQKIRLKNLRYAVELSEERVRIVEARYQIGALSRLDLQQANVDLNTDKSQLIKQYEVLHTFNTSLNRMMGLDNVESKLITADSTINYEVNLSKEVIWEKAMDNNIYLIISRKEGDITNLDLRLVRSKSYPYLRMSAGYGYTGNWYGTGTYTRQHTRGLNYGLTMGVNLFDGFNQKRRIRNAEIDLENSRLDYQNMELEIRVDLSNAWMAYRNNIELVELETSNLETARDNYAIAMERYQLGQLSGIELREAQNSLLEAEERLVQAQYDTKLCEISLRMIAGEIVAYTDPH